MQTIRHKMVTGITALLTLEKCLKSTKKALMKKDAITSQKIMTTTLPVAGLRTYDQNVPHATSPNAISPITFELESPAYFFTARLIDIKTIWSTVMRTRVIERF